VLHSHYPSLDGGGLNNLPVSAELRRSLPTPVAGGVARVPSHFLAVPVLAGLSFIAKCLLAYMTFATNDIGTFWAGPGEG
jgi:hypothetical protein